MAFLEINNVSKTFGPVSVLEDVSLSIEDGEFVVFVGPSGCGKSTLLRMISGLEDVSAGTISIAGEVLNDMEPAERGLMKEKRNKREKRELIDPHLRRLMLAIAIFTGLTTFVLFLLLLVADLPIKEIRGIVFVASSVSTLMFAFSCRSLKRSIFHGIFKNAWLWLAVGVSFLFLLLGIYVPLLQSLLGTQALSLMDWGIVFVASTIDIFLIEMFKKRFMKS